MQDMRKKYRYIDKNAIATTVPERLNLSTNISNSDEKILSSLEV